MTIGPSAWRRRALRSRRWASSGFEVDFSRTAGPLAVHGFEGEGLVTQFSGNFVVSIPIRAMRPYVLGAQAGCAWTSGRPRPIPASAARGWSRWPGAASWGSSPTTSGRASTCATLRQASVATTFRTLDLAPTGILARHGRALAALLIVPGGCIISERRSCGRTLTGARGNAARCGRGRLVGFLYLTDRGRRVRDQIEPMIESMISELERARGTVEKARDAALEGRRAVDDLLAPQGDSCAGNRLGNARVPRSVLLSTRRREPSARRRDAAPAREFLRPLSCRLTPESDVRIAYQGVTGAYSEAAALQFNPSADPLPRRSFDDVFDAVERREATHGILPIENTIGGTIHRNYDLMLEHELRSSPR